MTIGTGIAFASMWATIGCIAIFGGGAGIGAVVILGPIAALLTGLSVIETKRRGS